MEQAPTTDQLRHAIDSGATGEKVPFPDPAAAPLGTDAEAGGTPPTPRERLLELKARSRHAPVTPLNGPAIYVGLVALVGAAMLGVAILAR